MYNCYLKYKLNLLIIYFRLTAAMIAEAKHRTEIGLYLRGAEDALKFSQHTKCKYSQ